MRQKVLQTLRALGYPSSLIVIEKELSGLPHLRHPFSVPKRRLDILCYGKSLEGELIPLLLIECKKGQEEAEAQVMGYNHFVQAAFVAIAQGEEVTLIHPHRCSFIPSYAQLLERICP